MAFGAGSAVAHHGVNALLGGGSKGSDHGGAGSGGDGGGDMGQ